MTTIMIINETKTETNIYTTMQINSKEIFVGSNLDGTYVNVLVKNASHKVFRGMGKHFHGQNAFDKALEAYKSSEVKTAIKHVQSQL